MSGFAGYEAAEGRCRARMGSKGGSLPSFCIPEAVLSMFQVVEKSVVKYVRKDKEEHKGREKGKGGGFSSEAADYAGTPVKA